MNENYVNALSDFVASARTDSYFIVGSVALLSYTQPHGYDRQIHDIDIIMETVEAVGTAEKLKELGYTQNTFINPRMPFYSKLMKHSSDKYLRFSKDSVDIEILSTNFESKNELDIFELYPGVKAGLPKDVFSVSTYSGVQFRTVSKEMLFFFKKFANNTMGKKVKYKEQQRYDDISHLEKLVDKHKFDQLKKSCTLFVIGVPFKTPRFLIQ